MSESKRSLRRGLQFSLRSLLIAMLLVAVFLGGRESGRRRLAAERKRADDEQLKAAAATAHAEQASRRAKLAILQLQLQQAENDLRRLEQRLRRKDHDLQAAKQDYLAAAEKLSRQQWPLLPSDGIWRLVEPLPGPAPKRVIPRPRAVLINEYWQRRKRPVLFSDGPRLVALLSSVA